MKREIHLDYAKVFACFAVMIQHNCSLSGELRADYMTNYILYFLCRFAVPVFVITTGCLMLNDKRQLTFKDIFTKYIPRILLPFIGIVYIINITSALVDGTASWTLLYTPLASILAAQTSVPYWYCYMIIGLYIILPFIKHMVSACTKRELEIYLLLFFIFRGVLPYLQFVPLLDKCAPFLDSINLIIFNGYLGYLIVGYYLNKFVPVFHESCVSPAVLPSWCASHFRSALCCSAIPTIKPSARISAMCFPPI